MNKTEAKAILAEQLDRYRSKSYRELMILVGDVDAYEIPGPSGRFYQVEILVMWDHKPRGNLRVGGAIDEGGWSAFCPLSDDFIVAPKNRISN